MPPTSLFPHHYHRIPGAIVHLIGLPFIAQSAEGLKMPNDRPRLIEEFESSLPCTERPVHVLTVNKERFVETTYLLPCVPGGQQGASGNELRFSRDIPRWTVLLSVTNMSISSLPITESSPGKPQVIGRICKVDFR